MNIYWSGNIANGRLIIEKNKQELIINSLDEINPLNLSKEETAITLSFLCVLEIRTYEAKAKSSLFDEQFLPFTSALLQNFEKNSFAEIAIRRINDCFEHHEYLLTCEEMSARLLMEAKRIQRQGFVDFEVSNI